MTRKQEPNLPPILPVGTAVVTRVEVKGKDGAPLHPIGAGGMIVGWTGGGEGGITGGYSLHTTSHGGLAFRLAVGSGLEAEVVSRGHPAHTWLHVVARYNGEQASIYVNGVLEGYSPDSVGSLSRTKTIM